ncbi:hypothetical protein GYMLUDRAFT_81456 [Collybiopsis luxurians FD-317 M1]|nr:hypothetical protein GYMLUDRAFT_81456 [Collybiopsis luxurians FD-317 M1]
MATNNILDIATSTQTNITDPCQTPSKSDSHFILESPAHVFINEPSKRLMTPTKPRITPLIPPSFVSPIVSLPLPVSPAVSNKRSALESSPSFDDLSFSILSSPNTERLLYSDFSDLHISPLCGAKGEGTPLRTPFHPISLSLSSESPLMIDLAAFPMFNAKIGPTADRTTSSTRPLLRPDLRSVNTASAANSRSVIPQRKIFKDRRSSVYHPPNMMERNQASGSSKLSQKSLQHLSQDQSRHIFHSFELHQLSPSSMTAGSSEDDAAAPSAQASLSSSSDYLHAGPYDSNHKRIKPSRPILIAGFLQNLPPFQLPTSPTCSPISMSPLTPSRRTAPLKSPFLIRRRNDPDYL